MLYFVGSSNNQANEFHTDEVSHRETKEFITELLELYNGNINVDSFAQAKQDSAQIEKDRKEYIIYRNVVSEGRYKVAIDVERLEQLLELALTYDE